MCRAFKQKSHHSFQDDAITLDTDNPDLTDCFQKTVLTWIPCGTLFVTLFYWVPYLYRLPAVHNWCNTSPLNLMKIVRLEMSLHSQLFC